MRANKYILKLAGAMLSPMDAVVNQHPHLSSSDFTFKKHQGLLQIQASQSRKRETDPPEGPLEKTAQADQTPAQWVPRRSVWVHSYSFVNGRH